MRYKRWGAVNVSDLRKRLGIHDNQKWKRLRKDAKNIFHEGEGPRQCGTTSHGWKVLAHASLSYSCQLLTSVQLADLHPSLQGNMEACDEIFFNCGLQL